MAADMSETDFLRAFDLMGIQRHMKAAGIFVRLALRDGKFGYLQGRSPQTGTGRERIGRTSD